MGGVRILIPPSSSPSLGKTSGTSSAISVGGDFEEGVDGFEAEDFDNEGTVGRCVLGVDDSLIRSPPFRTLKEDDIEGETTLVLSTAPVGECEVGTTQCATMRS